MTHDVPTAIDGHQLMVVRARETVLRAIDLVVASGETVAIMGANGAGKTTLLKVLAGLIRPTKGQLRWLDNRTITLSAVRQKIGFLGHEDALYNELTAIENLLFAARMHRCAGPALLVRNLLAESGLEAIANCTVNILSRGMRRRVAIIRATIHEPPIILLDEPFASLDATGERWLETRLRKWRQNGRTLCVTSHNAEQSRRLADRVMWLDRGQLTRVEVIGTPPQVLQQSA